MSYVVAIDQGTSGTKAIVVSAAGEVLASAEESIRPRYLPDGGVEQDPMEMLDSVLSTARRAVADAGVPIAAMALANQGETVLAWDRATGTPLTPAVVWQDRRSEGLCRDLAAYADMIAGRTGLVLDSYFSAPKMAWIRRHLTTDGVVTTTDTWLAHQLCGEFVTDVSTASRSLLLDLDAVAWDAELQAIFGLEGEPLPDLVDSDAIVGETSVLGYPVPLTGLIVDQQAALLAQSCVEPGTAKCTFGTGAFLLAQTGKMAARSTVGLTTSVAWGLRGDRRYCIDGQVYTAASAVRWLTDMGLISGAADLDAAAAADTDGVMCVPALAGLAAPWWRSEATATLTGLSLSTGPGQVVRAVIDGIAAQVATLVDAVGNDIGRPLTMLQVDGGLTRSRVLMQAQADLAQVPVQVYPSPHATALGAAVCGHLALDPGLTIAEAIGEWNPVARYEPIWSADRAEDYLARWRRVVEAGLAT